MLQCKLQYLYFTVRRPTLTPSCTRLQEESVKGTEGIILVLKIIIKQHSILHDKTNPFNFIKHNYYQNYYLYLSTFAGTSVGLLQEAI